MFRVQGLELYGTGFRIKIRGFRIQVRGFRKA